MKQTAVEFAIEKLEKFIPSGNQLVIYTILQEAKEMEKQQIIDADLNGSFRTANALDFKISPLRTKEIAEQYYNETFNK